MEDSSSLHGGPSDESPAAGEKCPNEAGEGTTVERISQEESVLSQSRLAEQETTESQAQPSVSSDTNSAETRHEGASDGETSATEPNRGEVLHVDTVDTQKGAVSYDGSTVDTLKGAVSDDPNTVDTRRISGDPNAVATLHGSLSDDKDTADTRQEKDPGDGDASPQNKPLLSAEDCSQEIAEPKLISANSVAGDCQKSTSSKDSQSNLLDESKRTTASQDHSKSDHDQGVPATAASKAAAAADDKTEQQVSWAAPCKEGSDSGEEGRYSCTEDEGSDWEGPVDVELEDTPLALPERKSSQTSWGTIKALTRLMPLSRRKYPWTQMAGHQGSFLSGPSGSVLKLLVPREEKNLKLLMAETRLRRYVPRYHGTVDKDGSCYVQLQDLLCEFTCPCVMDIKMGVRTYLEEELEKARKKPTLRKDLYQKMVSIDPEAPTDEERRESAILKPRYMKFRDDMSSTSSLGFRIEGIKTRSGASKDYKNTRTRDDVREALAAFIGDNTTALERYISQLTEIGSAQESSDFFRSHEMVGSSLLFVHDDSGRAGVWMIDFAKCCRLATAISVDHRSPWTPGNYEDGYLFGLDNLLSIFHELGASLEYSK